MVWKVSASVDDSSKALLAGGSNQPPPHRHDPKLVPKFCFVLSLGPSSQVLRTLLKDSTVQRARVMAAGGSGSGALGAPAGGTLDGFTVSQAPKELAAREIALVDVNQEEAEKGARAVDNVDDEDRELLSFEIDATQVGSRPARRLGGARSTAYSGGRRLGGCHFYRNSAAALAAPRRAVVAVLIFRQANKSALASHKTRTRIAFEVGWVAA